jgi:hypothetical protein
VYRRDGANAGVLARIATRATIGSPTVLMTRTHYTHPPTV